jgi:site-specific DNA-methyltransferase (adenine-specific)
LAITPDTIIQAKTHQNGHMSHVDLVASIFKGLESRLEIIRALSVLGDATSPGLMNSQGAVDLSPNANPICLARKPLSEGTVAANVLRHGVGALNIDGCRVATDENLNGGAYAAEKAKVGGIYNKLDYDCGEYVQPSGRWPANLIHDGSEEVLAAFPESKSSGTGGLIEYSQPNIRGDNFNRAEGRQTKPGMSFNDSGSAARYFYCAKASKKDRAGSKHPTVKPIKLMQYLVKLITPPGGVVMDPFAGTGTTGEAAQMEGFSAILIEREEEYLADIRRRFGMEQPPEPENISPPEPISP